MTFQNSDFWIFWDTLLYLLCPVKWSETEFKLPSIIEFEEEAKFYGEIRFLLFALLTNSWCQNLPWSTFNNWVWGGAKLHSKRSFEELLLPKSILIQFCQLKNPLWIKSNWVAVNNYVCGGCQTLCWEKIFFCSWFWRTFGAKIHLDAILAIEESTLNRIKSGLPLIIEF